MKPNAYPLSLTAVLLMLVLACSGISYASWKDGTYTGKHSFITVEVDIRGGDISDIRILRHGGGGKKYEGMASALIGDIIDKQSVDVDAVTGATVSSGNLKQAVQNALDKASS